MQGPIEVSAWIPQEEAIAIPSESPSFCLLTMALEAEVFRQTDANEDFNITKDGAYLQSTARLRCSYQP